MGDGNRGFSPRGCARLIIVVFGIAGAQSEYTPWPTDLLRIADRRILFFTTLAAHDIVWQINAKGSTNLYFYHRQKK